MSRRIDIELTSERPDGVWTWRAAGAKQPKGELDGTLLFAGAKVGDVVRADADFDIDGINVTAVLPPKGARREPERLEIIGTPTKLEPVTTTLAKRGKGDRGDRGERGGRRDRGERGDRGDRGDRGPRSRDGRPDRDKRERKPRAEGDGARRPPRPPRPEVEAKPKPKRLKAGRTHRNAVLADLPPEQRPVAEQVLKGGIPAVRQAVQKQNEAAEAEGKPPVKAEPLVALAEGMLPRLRSAEWRDKAEAALADIEELDLRDLRSVIVAADTGARDEESRALADQLRAALNRRVEQEHAAWLAEIAANLAEGRSVRALRLSSRPPKAGAPLPADMAARLADATAASLTSEVTQDRWATVLDALAFSPVRLNVVPESLPAVPSDELLKEVARLATQIPQIAAVFGVEPAPSGKRPRPRPPRPPKTAAKKVPPPPKGDKADKADKPDKDEAVTDQAKPDQADNAPEATSDAPTEDTSSAAASDESPSDESIPTEEADAAPSGEASTDDGPAPDEPEAASIPDPAPPSEDTAAPAAAPVDEPEPESAAEDAPPADIAAEDAPTVDEPEPESAAEDAPPPDTAAEDAPTVDDAPPPVTVTVDDTAPEDEAGA